MEWTIILSLIVVAGVLLLLKQLGQVRVAAAREYIKQGAKVIDVRSAAEYQSGHLSRVISIPLGEIQQRIAREVPNKEEILLLHCVSGTRSAMAARILKGMGYARAYNLGSYRRAERVLQE